MRKKPFLTKKAAVKFSFAHNPRHIGFFPKPMCGMQACFLRIAKPQHLRWEALGFWVARSDAQAHRQQVVEVGGEHVRESSEQGAENDQHQDNRLQRDDELHNDSS